MEFRFLLHYTGLCNRKFSGSSIQSCSKIFCIITSVASAFQEVLMREMDHSEPSFLENHSGDKGEQEETSNAL